MDELDGASVTAEKRNSSSWFCDVKLLHFFETRSELHESICKLYNFFSDLPGWSLEWANNDICVQ